MTTANLSVGINTKPAFESLNKLKGELAKVNVAIPVTLDPKSVSSALAGTKVKVKIDAADLASQVRMAVQEGVKGVKVGGGTSSTELTQLKAAFNQVQQTVSTLNAEVGKTLGSGMVQAATAVKQVGQAHTEATGKTKAHTAAMHDAHSAARGLASGMGMMWLTWGNIAPLLAGASLSHGFIQAMKAGSEFAYQLTFVKALGEETADSIGRISNAALELSKNSLYGPVELANGLRTLSQAGLSASESMKALPTVIDLATVGEMSMKDAAITLVGVMTAFNLEKTDFSKIGDVFAKAAAVSQTSVEQMTQAMKTASVVGEQYGASMGDTATALTLLAKMNITGTAAGTSLRNMLKELYSPTEKSAKLMKELGVSAQTATGELKPFPDIIFSLKGKLEEFNKASQVKILQGMFGERGAKEAVAMLSLTRTEWDKLNRTITESSGFMREVSAELEGTVKGSFKQAVNTLQVSLIEAYNSTEGAAGKLAGQLKETFGSAAFKESLAGIVSGMLSLTNALVAMAPALAMAAGGWAALRVATIGASIWTSVSTALAGATLAAQGLGAALAGSGGLLAAVRMLPAVGAAAMTSIVATTGVLGPLALAIGAAGVAWYLFRDRTVEAMQQSADAVAQGAASMRANLANILKDVHNLPAAMSRKAMDAQRQVLVDGQNSLLKQRETLNSQYGIKSDAEAEAFIAKATTTNSSGEVYTKTGAQYEAVTAYLKSKAAQKQALQDFSRVNQTVESVAASEVKPELPAATGKLKDWQGVGGGGGGSGLSVGVSDLTKKYDALNNAEAQHFKQQKELIDQRVKYGNLSQSAANVLLEVEQKKIDESTRAVRSKQVAELEALAAKKNLTAAERQGLQSRIAELNATQAADEAERQFTLTKRESLAQLKREQSERGVEKDITNFSRNINIDIAKEKLAFDMRSLSAESEAAVNKYVSVLEKGQEALKKYSDRIIDARDSLAALKAEFGEAGAASEVVSEAIAAQEEELDLATAAYGRMEEAVRSNAQAAAENTFNIKAEEEAINRMKSAMEAANAIMDATLSARKHSGYYTDLEALRAEGNINKEKLSQLAELKSAYEALGERGAAAAKQIEAQMIELSAHLDPVADKLRSIFEEHFTTFFEDVLAGTKSIKEAFKDLGKNLLSEFHKMLAKEASQQLMKLLGGGLEPGGSQGLFGILSKILVPGDIGKDIAATGRSVFNNLKGGSSMPDFSGLTQGLTSATTNLKVLSEAASGAGVATNSIKVLGDSASAAQAGIASVATMSSTASTSLGLVSVASNEASASTLLATTATEVGTLATEADTLITQASAAAKQLDVAATQASASAKTSSGGSDILGSIVGMFGGGGSSGIGGSFLDVAPMLAAKGAAFNDGYQAFAKGGTFSNSIVRQPTLFRFADGTGMMGEAGPEAIMPLARDSQGRLGVRYEGREAPQSRGNSNVSNNNINVTVNSKSGDPAEIRRSGAAVARQVASAVAGSGRYR